MKQKGFTIVELLIVVVVIAVLASITVVAYTGVRQQAHMSAMRSDFATVQKAVELYKVDSGGYPVCDRPADAAPEWVTGWGCGFSSVRGKIGNITPKTVAGYVSTGGASNSWGITLRLSDGQLCKAGHNLMASWWTSYGPCW